MNNKHIAFFFGLLIPIFIMVVLVRVVMNDMEVMKSVWSWYVPLFTIAGALAGTILEMKLSAKPKKGFMNK